MIRKIGWAVFAIGLLVLIVPIAVAAYFGGDVPMNLYAIPWASIGLIAFGWQLAHKKAKNGRKQEYERDLWD